jgi:hypothetical protein
MYDSVVTQQGEIHRGHATIINTHQQRQGIAAAEDPTNEELLASGAVRQYLETTEGRRLYAQYIDATEQTNKNTKNETNENTENETNKNTENENTENETTENETNENTENETNENTKENTDTSETTAGISLPQKEKCYTKEYWIERAAVAQQMSDKLTPLQRRVAEKNKQAQAEALAQTQAQVKQQTTAATTTATETQHQTEAEQQTQKLQQQTQETQRKQNPQQRQQQRQQQQPENEQQQHTGEQQQQQQQNEIRHQQRGTGNEEQLHGHQGSEDDHIHGVLSEDHVRGVLVEDHIRGMFTVMRRKYEAFVTDEDNEQNNRKQIKFETQAISIEDFIIFIVSIILRFWKSEFGKYPRWGSEVWKDRSLMGDPMMIA